MKTECQNCKMQIEKDWNFCPQCGMILNIYEDGKVSGFNDLTTLNVMDTLKTGGISIYVDSQSSEKPEIKVSAFGDFKKYESELKRRVGVYNETHKKTPAVIEEPESILRRKRNKVTIKVRMPGITEKDIKVNKYENSIEVRGYAIDKLYYISFEVPNNSEIVSKNLTEDIFTLILRV